MKYLLDLSHKQTAVVSCVIDRGSKEIGELLAQREQYSDDWVASEIRRLWGAIDAELTTLAHPDFHATGLAARVKSLFGWATKLDMTVDEYQGYISKLVLLRDQWYGTVTPDATAGEVIDSFVSILWITFSADWPLFIAALQPSARPTGNETNKP
ncbi:MAG: hypothetical protein AAF438_19790 [Pseudomonadota bacterium]